MLEPLWTATPPGAGDAPRRRFHALMQGATIVVAPGVYDGLSARIAELGGCECLLVSDALVSHALLGLPDGGLLAIDELADAVARVSSVVAAPVCVHVRAGTDTPLRTAHAVHRLEKAGAAAICLVDTAHPAASGAGRLVAIADMEARLHAALAARDDPELVVGVACGARDTDEARRRSEAYTAAGAELVSMPLACAAALSAGAAGTARYRAVAAGGADDLPAEIPLASLQAMGFALATVELTLLRAASLGMTTLADDIAERGVAGDLALIERLADQPIEDWYSFTGFDRIRALEDRYLPSAALAKYTEGPAPYYQPAPVPRGR